MTTLAIFKLPQTEHPIDLLSDFDVIASILAGAQIRLERWDFGGLPVTADSDAILNHFKKDIERLSLQEGYTAADVIRITPDHPDKQALREKYLQEHTHTEDEVRFFVAGSGAFFVPLGDKVFRLTCEAGDLLRVPANTRHWFDCGAQPNFTAIRLFTNQSGWVGNFTKSETFH